MINKAPLENITVNNKPLYVPVNEYLDEMAHDIMRWYGCNYRTAVIAIVKKTMEWNRESLDFWSASYRTEDPVEIANDVDPRFAGWCIPGRDDMVRSKTQI